MCEGMEANNNNSVKRQMDEEERRPPLARDETIDDSDTEKVTR